LLIQTQDEAIAGRARMSENPENLLPELISDPNVKPPFSNTQINENAMHNETLNIYRLARPETRRYYERGHYWEGESEENWIIRWLLWHVFRYRDNRNRGRTMPAWITSGSEGSPPQGTYLGTSVNTSPDSKDKVCCQACFSAHHISTATRTSSQNSTSTRYYYDPVRDAERANK